MKKPFMVSAMAILGTLNLMVSIGCRSGETSKRLDTSVRQAEYKPTSGAPLTFEFSATYKFTGVRTGRRRQLAQLAWEISIHSIGPEGPSSLLPKTLPWDFFSFCARLTYSVLETDDFEIEDGTVRIWVEREPNTNVLEGSTETWIDYEVALHAANIVIREFSHSSARC